jgi:hypothetical protein
MNLKARATSRMVKELIKLDHNTLTPLWKIPALKKVLVIQWRLHTCWPQEEE